MEGGTGTGPLEIEKEYSKLIRTYTFNQVTSMIGAAAGFGLFVLASYVNTENNIKAETTAEILKYVGAISVASFVARYIYGEIKYGRKLSKFSKKNKLEKLAEEEIK